MRWGIVDVLMEVLRAYWYIDRTLLLATIGLRKGNVDSKMSWQIGAEFPLCSDSTGFPTFAAWKLSMQYWFRVYLHEFLERRWLGLFFGGICLRQRQCVGCPMGLDLESVPAGITLFLICVNIIDKGFAG